jgi:RNA polymerase sigma-70 factor (ECF subfamily)
MLEMTQTQLITRAQQGDAQVISALYERYHLSIYRYLYYRVGNRHAAEDLTSEVFLRMLRFLPGYKTQGGSFQAWLFQIARNLAIDYHRQMVAQNPVELEEDLIATNEDPANATEQGLTSQSLRKALNRLTDEQRDVIVMRFVAAMPITEVAQTLHKSEASIKGLQRRALIALRETLNEWEIAYDGQR